MLLFFFLNRKNNLKLNKSETKNTGKQINATDIINSKLLFIIIIIVFFSLINLTLQLQIM